MGKKRIRRKTKRQHVRVPFPAVIANFLVVATVLGISYTFLCARCDDYGDEIKRQESDLVAAQKQLANEEALWSSQTKPSNLERAIAMHGLNMVLPREEQLVFVGYQGVNGAVAYRF